MIGRSGGASFDLAAFGGICRDREEKKEELRRVRSLDRFLGFPFSLQILRTWFSTLEETR